MRLANCWCTPLNGPQMSESATERFANAVRCLRHWNRDSKICC